MKKYAFILALFIGGYAISNASILTKNEVELEVGSNPVSIIEDPSDGMIHIFCAGIDANDNNEYDEGEDEKPSWWTYNPAGSSIETMMVKEFDNYFVSPFKPSVLTYPAWGTAFSIYFKSNTNNGEFIGVTENIIYQASSTNQLLSSDFVFEGELIYYNENDSYSISLIRKNVVDVISVRNKETDVVKETYIEGDVIDFVTFSDEEENKYLAPVIFDGEKTKLVVFDISPDVGVEMLFEYDLGLLGVNNDSVASITSDGKSIFITFKSNLYVSVFTLNEKKTGFLLPHFKPVEIERTKNIFTLPIDENIHLVSKASKDLVVVNLFTIPDNGQIEMHHSKFDIGYMYSTGEQVYCANTTSNEKKVGRISIYDFTNEPNKDLAQIDMAYAGFQPLDFFPYGMYLNFRYYTVCLGIDYNYDGIIKEEEGDLPPSIWATEANDFGYRLEYTTLNNTLDFPINFPLNTNISTYGDIPLPSGNAVHFYNVEDMAVYNTFDAGMYVASVDDYASYLVMGLRDYETGKSYVRIRKDEIRDFSIEVAKNVSDLIAYSNEASNFSVLSVSEGTFGQSDAKINLIMSDPITGEKTNTEFEAGAMGSAVVANSDYSKAAIVMNGSHEIHIFDLNTNEITLTFPTGTSGYGGPRDAKFYNDKLYVTTYSNNILVFDYSTGKLIGSTVIDGNSEGFVIEKRYILVTNNQYSNNQPNNRIATFGHPLVTNVETTTPTQQTIRVYPHPVSNDFHLVSDDLAGTNDIAIINSQGKIVATHSGSSNGAIALNADALGLISGNYTVVINGTRAVRFVVIK